MSRSISTGIDVGTSQIKVVIARKSAEREMPRIIGTGFAESKGLRHGYVLNQGDVIKSLHQAVNQAELAAKIKIKKTIISIGGIGLSAATSTGSTIISRADTEITERDIENVLAASLKNLPQNVSQNRTIIHSIPINYKIDGKPVLGKPLGLKGGKLEVKTLFVGCLEHHLRDLIEAVEGAGIIVEDEVVAAPLAASVVTLTKPQKVAGCVLANIGSETVSIVVYENGIPVSLEVFPIGSNDITNDIALGLKIPLEEAEEAKRGLLVGAEYPKRKLDEIISARLSDIFELIEAHLKKIGRSGLLPAGIILTGGGAGIDMIEDMAKTSLRLPSRTAQMQMGDKSRLSIKDASWSVSYGLAIIGLTSDSESPSPFALAARQVKTRAAKWIKQFFP
ncbi:MAG: cell division protein FtsA [bacterium]|nr:cell division protein FtsA [bacterium]